MKDRNIENRNTDKHTDRQTYRQTENSRQTENRQTDRKQKYIKINRKTLLFFQEFVSDLVIMVGIPISITLRNPTMKHYVENWVKSTKVFCFLKEKLTNLFTIICNSKDNLYKIFSFRKQNLVTPMVTDKRDIIMDVIM